MSTNSTPNQPTLKERVDVVMPVYNEASHLEGTCREIIEVLSEWVEPRIIACEDGSSDGSRELLQSLERQLPLLLVTAADRRGYARAVIDGILAADAPFVLAMDADGQIDPRDFSPLWANRNAADIVRGWRRRRSDPLSRQLLSRTFKMLYDALFQLDLPDPSCPFVLGGRETLQSLVRDLGTMKVGFWWEFMASAAHKGLRVQSHPIGHRPRRSGTSRAIEPSDIPHVAVTHTLALLRLRARLASRSNG